MDIDTSKDLEDIDIVVLSQEEETWTNIKKETEKLIWQIENDMKKLPQALMANKRILTLAEEELKLLKKNQS